MNNLVPFPISKIKNAALPDKIKGRLVTALAEV